MRYVCDKSPDKWGKEAAAGVWCISPKQLSEMKDVAVLIMSDNAGVGIEMVHDITDLGIRAFDHVENWLKAVTADEKDFT